MIDQQRIVVGHYFYDTDKFIQKPTDANKYSKETLGKSLDEAIRDEQVVSSQWSIEELSLLLNKSITELINRKVIVLNDNLVKAIREENTEVRNYFKTVTTQELTTEIKNAIVNHKQVLKGQIFDMLKEPRRQRAEAEERKNKANSVASSQAILNEICALDAEIVAYCRVIELLKQ